MKSFSHNREPAAIDQQTVIRMNRDTLYSFAVADISQSATLTVPHSAERYLSVMIVNEDHYINRVFHDAGRYELTVEEFDTSYVVVAASSLIPGFLTTSQPWQQSRTVSHWRHVRSNLRVARLRHGQPRPHPKSPTGYGRRPECVLEDVRTSGGHQPCAPPDRHRRRVRRTPRRRGDLRGGVPEPPRRRVRPHPRRRTGRRVLIDLGLRRGRILGHNDEGAYSINNIAAARNDDGAVTVRFGGDGENALPITREMAGLAG